MKMIMMINDDNDRLKWENLIRDIKESYDLKER